MHSFDTILFKFPSKHWQIDRASHYLDDRISINPPLITHLPAQPRYLIGSEFLLCRHSSWCMSPITRPHLTVVSLSRTILSLLPQTFAYIRCSHDLRRLLGSLLWMNVAAACRDLNRAIDPTLSEPSPQHRLSLIRLIWIRLENSHTIVAKGFSVNTISQL